MGKPIRKSNAGILKPRVATANATSHLLGLPRDRVYSREDICIFLGYFLVPDGPVNEDADPRNANRYFRDYFLKRGLPVTRVGKTYFFTGEALYTWVAANARQVNDE